LISNRDQTFWAGHPVASYGSCYWAQWHCICGRFFSSIYFM